MEKEKRPDVKWAELLDEAVSKPGSIMSAYSNFHNYSLGNCLLALFQCSARNLEPGPMAPYKKWQELGRQVKRGEKALTLCMPLTSKTKELDENGEPVYRTFFAYKRRWFVLAQTEGEEYKPEPIPDWSKERALSELGIQEVAFDDLDGNIQGWAKPGEVSLNPLAAEPHKTLFHELAHNVLGHCGEATMSDGEHLSRNIREVEAESVALICCEALGLPGAEFSRGYIQHWGSEIPEKSARRIFTAADKILKAGRVHAD